MIVGENARADDMDVNPTKEKKLTNIRSSTGDELERLIPAKRLSLEQALSSAAGTRCVEVTPAEVRLRKTQLDATSRARAASRRKASKPEGRPPGVILRAMKRSALLVAGVAGT